VFIFPNTLQWSLHDILKPDNTSFFPQLMKFMAAAAVATSFCCHVAYSAND
jgi:hypothetical protein